MSIWDNPALAGAIGVAFGGATAYIQGALSARAKSGEELRERRLEAYPPVWRKTSTLSRYPAAEVTWADLKALHLAFRSWYFTTGGLFLSERSRDRYGELQELLGAYLYLHRGDDPARRVDTADYEGIAETCSVFRTAMKKISRRVGSDHSSGPLGGGAGTERKGARRASESTQPAARFSACL